MALAARARSRQASQRRLPAALPAWGCHRSRALPELKTAAACQQALQKPALYGYGTEHSEKIFLNGIPVELFHNLKDDAVKVLHSICQQIWKTQQWPQDWKRSVFIPIPKKGNVKECSNYHTIALISHASKVMLKILQARLQQYMNHELPDVQAGFRKGRGTRDQIANICWIMEKAREFHKNIYFCFID